MEDTNFTLVNIQKYEKNLISFSFDQNINDL